MKTLAWLLAWGIALELTVCLVAAVVVGGGALFNPGPLSTERGQEDPLAEFATHADFETRCELCHAPFRGPDASLCLTCHARVRSEMETLEGLHGKLSNPELCTQCHTDHKGRTASLTTPSLADLPHNQFGFSLVSHQRDYAGAAMTCRSCHGEAARIDGKGLAALLTACLACHRLQDSGYVSAHRSARGDACIACHDGSHRLAGFSHTAVYALQGAHARVDCLACHKGNLFRSISRECSQCHPDPPSHRAQFGADCASCHTTTGWRPARLLKHAFPLDHGGKESACRVCHPTNYATFTCTNCHAHTQADMALAHSKQAIPDFQNCIQCHPTGKKTNAHETGSGS